MRPPSHVVRCSAPPNSVALRNRRLLSKRLAAFLDNVVISPGLATTVCNGDVNQEYLSAVEELNRKYRYVTRREPADDGSSVDIAPSLTVAGAELTSHISKLRLLAVQKVRSYFLASIASLRKARTNVKQVQVRASE